MGVIPQIELFELLPEGLILFRVREPDKADLTMALIYKVLQSLTCSACMSGPTALVLPSTIRSVSTTGTPQSRIRSSDFLRSPPATRHPRMPWPGDNPRLRVRLLVRHGMKQEPVPLLPTCLFSSDKDAIVSGVDELEDVFADQKCQISRYIRRGNR